MARYSSIEWTGCSWNWGKGCSKCSPGCFRCYAVPLSHRLAAKAGANPDKGNGYEGTTEKRNGKLIWTGRINVDWEALSLPFDWKPSTIFANSMSDALHEDMPLKALDVAFAVMNATPQHTYQILTKRPENLIPTWERWRWSDNIWLGVSVENADYLWRVDILRTIPAKTKFISAEPLLGPLTGLNLMAVDWLICGGESGPRARAMNPQWARELRDLCVAAHVPFFFKQHGNVDQDGVRHQGKKYPGYNLLDGQLWDQMPERL